MLKPPNAPFPAFGGKSTIASAIWQRLGRARNIIMPLYDGRREFDYGYDYIEPFGNSLAVLLANPDYDWSTGREIAAPGRLGKAAKNPVLRPGCFWKKVIYPRPILPQLPGWRKNMDKCSACGILFDLPAHYNVRSERAGDGRCVDCHERGLTKWHSDPKEQLTAEGHSAPKEQRNCQCCGRPMISKAEYCHICLHRGMYICSGCGGWTHSPQRICRKCK